MFIFFSSTFLKPSHFLLLFFFFFFTPRFLQYSYIAFRILFVYFFYFFSLFHLLLLTFSHWFLSLYPKLEISIPFFSFLFALSHILTTILFPQFVSLISFLFPSFCDFHSFSLFLSLCPFQHFIPRPLYPSFPPLSFYLFLLLLLLFPSSLPFPLRLSFRFTSSFFLCPFHPFIPRPILPSVPQPSFRFSSTRFLSQLNLVRALLVGQLLFFSRPLTSPSVQRVPGKQGIAA